MKRLLLLGVLLVGEPAIAFADSNDTPPIPVGSCIRTSDPAYVLCRGGEDWYRLVEIRPRAIVPL